MHARCLWQLYSHGHWVGTAKTAFSRSMLSNGDTAIKALFSDRKKTAKPSVKGKTSNWKGCMLHHSKSMQFWERNPMETVKRSTVARGWREKGAAHTGDLEAGETTPRDVVLVDS